MPRERLTNENGFQIIFDIETIYIVNNLKQFFLNFFFIILVINY
jgi:hypothetical protein